MSVAKQLNIADVANFATTMENMDQTENQMPAFC